MAGYIDTRRQESLAEILSFLQSKLREYQDDKRLCPQGLRCNAMVLGSLTIGLKKIGVLQSPDPPYVGFQFSKFTNQLKEIEILHLCQKSHSNGGCMGLKENLLNKIDQEAKLIRGLKLQNYKDLPKP